MCLCVPKFLGAFQMRRAFFYQMCRGMSDIGLFYILLPPFLESKVMKKKFFYAGVFCLWASGCLAQLNVQLHYDLGHKMYGHAIASRQHLTATVENFSADRWGSTYFFVDADLGDNVLRGAYGELAREFQTAKMPVAFHVEYNGGLSYGSGHGDGYAFGDAYLAGMAYNWNGKDFTKGFSVQALYKYTAKSGPYCHGWHLTGVWRYGFLKGLCSFTGFVDLWHDNRVNGNLVLVSEPQFWFNLAALKKVSDDFRLSVGTEVEISNNFVYTEEGCNNRFLAIPTLACKWEF